EVIVHVSDASGQELDQAYTLRVIDRSAAPPSGPAPPLDADPLRRASSPAPAPLANSGLRPVKLPQPQVVKPLPSTASNLVVGGGGRYLVFHLPREQTLAVFDVSETRIVRFIPLSASNAIYAAGMDKVVVVLPESNVIQRWDLTTGERELSVPL